MAHVGEVGSGQIIERAGRSVGGLLQRMLDFLRTPYRAPRLPPIFLPNGLWCLLPGVLTPSVVTPPARTIAALNTFCGMCQIPPRRWWRGVANPDLSTVLGAITPETVDKSAVSLI